MWYSNKIKPGIRIRLAIGSILLFAFSLSAQEKDSTNLSRLEQVFQYRSSEVSDLQELASYTELPEAWKNNSAIVLLDYTRYFVEGSGNKPNYGLYTQTRVLLNDQYAVNDFSSFTIEESEWFEVKVYKKDGKVVLLDRSRAVSGDVWIYNKKEKIDLSFTTEIRIPVPNLEVGDIIVYERFWENIYGEKGRIPFRPRYFRSYLNERFPVVKRVIDIDLSSAFYLKWQSINGAPELQLREEKEGSKTYRFVDEMRQNVKGEYWSAKDMEFPQVKFSIQKKPKKTSARIETGLGAYSKDWFLAMAKEANQDYKNSHSGYYLEYDKEESVLFRSERSVKDFYVKFRRYYFIQLHEPEAEFDNYKFIVTMGRLLKKWQLDYELVMALPKEAGTIDQVVHPDEIYWAIRIKETGTVLGEFSVHSSINEWENSVRGTMAYFVDFSGKNKKKGRIYQEEIPTQTMDENTYNYFLTIKLDGNILKVNRVNSFTGLARYGDLGDLPYFIFDEDYTALYGSKYGLGIVPYYLYKDQSSGLEKTLEDLSKRYWKDQFARASRHMVNNLSNPYYEVENYELTEIMDGGRATINPTLVYSEAYEAHGLVYNADTNLVINIGHLLEHSFTLFDTEDSLRLTGIDYGLPRMLVYDLNFSIPEGYKCVGIEQFDTILSNETGSYEVRGELKEKTFVIHVTRSYTAPYFDKSHWPQVMELLELSTFIKTKHILLIKAPK